MNTPAPARPTPQDKQITALQEEIEALKLANGALQRRLSIDATQADELLREMEAQRNDLRASHQRQHDLAAFTQRVIDAIGNLVVVLDTKGDIVRVNRGAADYLGLASPLTGGALLDDWLARDELALLRAALPPIPWPVRSVVLETARSAGQYRGEHRLRSTGGVYRYFLFEATLLHNRQGKEEGVAVSAIDFTAMKEAEVNLRLAASVFDSSLNGIIIADANTVIQRVNPAFTAVLGYNAAEMISQRPRMLQSGLHDEAFYSRLWADLTSRDSWQGEIIDRHKDGRLLHIWQSISAVRNEQGSVSHYVASFFDITAIKKLELELREARDAAETAARAKGDFLANMSHEIRTPMNGIIGMLKLLTHTELDPIQFDYVGKTQSAALSLLGILNDILDYSKVAAGKMALDHQEFVLNGLMQEIAFIASANLGAKPIELVYVLDPELPESFVGDALRLKQVLTNLIGNAIKFTPAGEVVVHVDLIESSPAGVEVEFSVRDTGIGIAADKLQKIFESFSQAESSTTRKFGGTGLGLAISQSLVSLMGGSLQVASKEGHGSRFFFRIRLGFVAAGTAIARSQAYDPDTGMALGHRIRTLVVDDSTIAREEIRRMVDRFGWNVDTAASGDEALQKIALASQAGADYQLIFMDWQMPGLDGLATTRRLREIEIDGQRPVVILLTAFDPQQMLHTDPDAKALFDAFLVKPVTASAIFDGVMTTRAGSPRPVRRPEPVAARRLAGLSILVVEDNPLNRQVAKGLLALEGATTELAECGLEGVARILDETLPLPDVVLMDVQMPDIDGYEATRLIRASARGITVPIIAMTANVMEQDIAAAAAAGMNGHIAKPIDLDDLVAKVRSICPALAVPPVDVLIRPTLVDGPAAPSVKSAPLAAPKATAAIEIDVAGAIARIGNMDDLYAEIIDGFTVDVPALLQELDTDLGAGRLDTGLRLSHTIKGLAAMVGASQLAAIASRAQDEWNDGVTMDRARQLQHELTTSLADTLPVLAAIRTGLPF